jgi:hypothetical protein
MLAYVQSQMRMAAAASDDESWRNVVGSEANLGEYVAALAAGVRCCIVVDGYLSPFALRGRRQVPGRGGLQVQPEQDS